MKQAIVNFCKSMDTGLFLLDMPTGFGKTYSVLDFMVDNYDAPEFKDKKIFFVTTLKKNLPDKELREHFAKRGKADDYDKYCLRIEANADMVVEKLDELYRARKIPAAITMKQEFKDLHGSVKLLNEYRDKKRELKTIMMRLNSKIRRFSLLQPLRKICRIRSCVNILQSAVKQMIMINIVCE